MTSDQHALKPHHAPMHGFDEGVERILGVDMRLLYGMGVPVVGMSVVIALLLAFAASPWVVGGLLVLEAAVLGVVLVGFMGMLNEENDDDGESA